MVLATPMQERSLGRGPLAEPTLRWSPWAAGIFFFIFDNWLLFRDSKYFIKKKTVYRQFLMRPNKT